MHLHPEEKNDPLGLAQRETIERDSERLVSGGDGWWTVRGLQPGAFEVRVAPDGYLNLRRPGVVLREGETTSIGTLTLEPGSSLSGRVVDRDDEPVNGAELLARWRDFRGRYSRSSISGDGGEFEISGLPDHALTLEARAEGFATSTLAEASARDGAIRVALDELGGIRGRVQPAERGAAEWFTVRAVPKRRPGGGFGDLPDEITEMTDSFELGRLAPGTYSVEVRAPSTVTARIERVKVLAGEVTDVGTVRLEPGLRLRGRVLRGDGDAPVVGARIRADRGAGPASWGHDPADAIAVSSRDGSFAVDGLEATRYTFTLDHALLAPLQRSVVVDAEQALDVVVFRMTAGGSVAGTVLDRDELPVAGASIVIYRPYGGYDVRTTSTEADGSFRASRLAPGQYMVILTGPSYRGGLGNGMRTVEIRDGEVTAVAFRD